MFLLYFLDTYMNLVKCLQRVPLDVSTDWRYLHQDAGKTYSQMSYWHQRWYHTGSFQKQPYAGIWKRILDTYVENYLSTNQALPRKDGELH